MRHIKSEKFFFIQHPLLLDHLTFSTIIYNRISIPVPKNCSDGPNILLIIRRVAKPTQLLTKPTKASLHDRLSKLIMKIAGWISVESLLYNV